MVHPLGVLKASVLCHFEGDLAWIKPKTNLGSCTIRWRLGVKNKNYQSSRVHIVYYYWLLSGDCFTLDCFFLSNSTEHIY